MDAPLRVLYVDDYPLDRELVRDSLEREQSGFILTQAASRAEFQACLADGDYDVVLSDFNILGFDGLQVLDAIRKKDPEIPVIIVTGTGSEEIAVEAMKRGAADYVIKTPSHIQRLPLTIGAIMEKRRSERQRIQLEKQLRQAQKMEALGTLAGGIAHDFNNILAAITGYTELALLEAVEGSVQTDNLRQVLSSSLRAKDLVQQILAFSRQSEQERKPLQVGLIVKEAFKLLRASVPSTIELQMDVSTSAIVMGDPTQMHQVVMNLCTNSAQAMKEKGGMLSVCLSEIVLDTKDSIPFPDLEPGRYLRLTVEDTGHGIDPAIIERIFDPFFTTKGAGEGTGLGLSVVHGIVRSHGGVVKVYSEPDKGAAFHVLFPIVESPPVYGAAPDSPIPRGSERILLVDDEPMLSAMGKQMLERLGYSVDAKTSSIDALEAFRSRPAESPFDLVITDLTMPHMTGIQLARELQLIKPGIPIILCTGFSEKTLSEKAREAGIRGVIMKPVVMREIGELVWKVLDAEK